VVKKTRSANSHEATRKNFCRGPLKDTANKGLANHAALLTHRTAAPSYNIGVYFKEKKRGSIVNKKVLVSSIALAIIIVTVCSGFGSGSTQRKPATSPAQPAGALSYLPVSDGIALIDVRRLMNETMPRILAGDPAKLAQANADIDKFKTRTGIDPRAFDRVVLGMRYTYP
jgi:hypothetical protein